MSSTDDVTVSPEVVEKWLDANADWLADYLSRRRSRQTPLTMSSSTGQLRADSSPADHVLLGKQQQQQSAGGGGIGGRARCWSRGSTGSTWTSTRTSENGAGVSGNSPNLSPNLIVLQSAVGDHHQHHDSTDMFFPSVSCSTSSLPPSSSSAPSIFSNRHQRTDSKKHLRHDFARTRASAVARVTDTQHHQQVNGQTNGGGSVVETTLNQQDLSFTSFDGCVHLIV